MLSRIPTPRCTICEDERNDLEVLHIDSLDGTVCTECVEDRILPLFHCALQSEANYPVPQGLNVMDFASFLGADFVERFLQREKGYKMKDPVFCQHKILSIHAPELGSSAPKDISVGPVSQAHFEQIGRKAETCGAVVCERASSQIRTACFRCRGELCARCGKPHHSSFEKHECRVEKIDADNIEGKLGQKIGKDIQFCPNRDCRQVLGLSAGCNHIVCDRCGTNFCFLCGQEAKEGSMHWTREDNHPRFGQPGDSNAIYDSEIEGEGLFDGNDPGVCDIFGLDDTEEAMLDRDSNDRSGEGSSGDEEGELNGPERVLPIAVEQFHDVDDQLWFEMTIPLSSLLEEIREYQDPFLPAFLPVLLDQRPPRNLVICFQGDLHEERFFFVREARIVEAGDLFTEGNASIEVVTAIRAMNRYLEENDREILATLVGNMTLRFRVTVAAAVEDDEAPESEQVETNVDEDQTTGSDDEEDPLADLLRLERDLDRFGVSNADNDDGYDGDEE